MSSFAESLGGAIQPPFGSAEYEQMKQLQAEQMEQPDSCWARKRAPQGHQEETTGAESKQLETSDGKTDGNGSGYINAKTALRNDNGVSDTVQKNGEGLGSTVQIELNGLCGPETADGATEEAVVATQALEAAEVLRRLAWALGEAYLHKAGGILDAEGSMQELEARVLHMVQWTLSFQYWHETPGHPGLWGGLGPCRVLQMFLVLSGVLSHHLVGVRSDLERRLSAFHQDGRSIQLPQIVHNTLHEAGPYSAAQLMQRLANSLHKDYTADLQRHPTPDKMVREWHLRQLHTIADFTTKVTSAAIAAALLSPTVILTQQMLADAMMRSMTPHTVRSDLTQQVPYRPISYVAPRECSDLHRGCDEHVGGILQGSTTIDNDGLGNNFAWDCGASRNPTQ